MTKFGVGLVESARQAQRIAKKGGKDPFQARKGEVTFSFGLEGAFQSVVIYGGPYDNFPAQEPSAFGVCVRSERVPKCVDVHLPIHDFSTPDPSDPDLVASAVLTAFNAAFAGRQVYVGCMGGMGRTGLFLAIMARCVGIEKPVEFIREHYYRGAVETEEQYQYVMAFDIDEVQRRIRARAWRHQILGFADDVKQSLLRRFLPS